MKFNKNRHLYEFGPFSLNATEKIFLRNQELIPLTPKAFDTLLFLVQKNGQLIEKDELIAAVWPDSFVVENSLTQNIHQLRKVLGEKSDGTSYIETIPRRGYRFTADIKEVWEEEPAVVYGVARGGRVLIDEDEVQDLVQDEIIDYEPNELRQTSLEEANTIVETKPETKIESSSSLNKGLRQFVTKRNVIAVCGLIAVALGAFALWQWKKNQPIGFHPKSIAILPFKPLRQNDSDERLGIGMADALIMKLSNQQQLQVKPTSAIIKYVGHEHNAIDVGRQLEVDAVVDGTLQREDSRVRVSVQVFDVKTAKPIWSGKFDELYTDIFTVQDAISQRISEVITLQLNASEKQHLWKRYTNNTEAYQAYIMGIYFWNKRTKDDLAKASVYLQQAIAKDPNYALAYAALADCYYLQRHYMYVEWTPEDAFQKVTSETNKALAIDPNLAEAYVALGGAQITFQKNLKGAEESYRKAIALNPNYSTAHLRYGWLLHVVGRWQDALMEMKKAQELDPLSATNNSALGSVLMMTRKYDEALYYCRRAVELDPIFHLARSNLAAALIRKGQYNEAIAELQKLSANKDARLGITTDYALVYALMGKHNEAKKYLDEVLNTEKKSSADYYNVGAIYAALGDKDKAFEWINKMEKDTPRFGVMLRNDPDLDSLRNDPRFEELLKKYTAEFSKTEDKRE